MKKKLFVKVMLALVATLFTVQFLSKSVFLGNGPQIRPDAGSAVTMVLSGFIDSVTIPLARLFNASSTTSADQKLANSELKKITTGVYAKDAGNATYIELREGEVVWREYETTVDGKKVTVKIVDGTNAPSQTALENFLK
jgi:hypothetical protein